jgi:hypothetical protein
MEDGTESKDRELDGCHLGSGRMSGVTSHADS